MKGRESKPAKSPAYSLVRDLNLYEAHALAGHDDAEWCAAHDAHNSWEDVILIRDDYDERTEDLDVLKKEYVCLTNGEIVFYDQHSSEWLVANQELADWIVSRMMPSQSDDEDE